MKTFKEFRNLLESHLEETYDIYHDHYNAAVNHAAEHVHKKTGLHVHDRDLMNIPRKPTPGQTNSLRFQLHKDGQPTNKYAHVQVHHHDSKKEKPFELNTYHDTGKHKIEEGNAENKAEYNQQSVDKAIANSRQKIGKKESKAIHRLLKGRRSKNEEVELGEGNAENKAKKNAYVARKGRASGIKVYDNFLDGGSRKHSPAEDKIVGRKDLRRTSAKDPLEPKYDNMVPHHSSNRVRLDKHAVFHKMMDSSARLRRLRSQKKPNLPEQYDDMYEGNAENKAKKREFDKTLAKNVAARRGYMQRALDNKQDGFKNEVQAGRAVRKMVRSSSMAKIAKGQEWIDRMKEGVEHMDEGNAENKAKKNAYVDSLGTGGTSAFPLLSKKDAMRKIGRFQLRRKVGFYNPSVEDKLKNSSGRQKKLDYMSRWNNIPKKEGVEHMDGGQINELKKSTLQSYADKVGGSSRGGGSGQLGVLKKKVHAEVKSGDTAAAQTTAQKYMKRFKGLKTAVDKLHQRRFETNQHS